jgi:hypothetical protein
MPARRRRMHYPGQGRRSHDERASYDISLTAAALALSDYPGILRLIAIVLRFLPFLPCPRQVSPSGAGRSAATSSGTRPLVLGLSHGHLTPLAIISVRVILSSIASAVSSPWDVAPVGFTSRCAAAGCAAVQSARLLPLALGFWQGKPSRLSGSTPGRQSQARGLSRVRSIGLILVFWSSPRLR